MLVKDTELFKLKTEVLMELNSTTLLIGLTGTIC